jgi:hypothetical protein
VSFHGFGYGTAAGLSNDPNINLAGQQQQEREEDEMEQEQAEGARPDRQPLCGNANVAGLGVLAWAPTLLMSWVKDAVGLGGGAVGGLYTLIATPHLCHSRYCMFDMIHAFFLSFPCFENRRGILHASLCRNIAPMAI